MRLKRHKKFITDLKKVRLSDSQFEKLILCLNAFMESKELPKQVLDHELKGDYLGFREFHLGGDMLVIYYQKEENITLARIGTHSQLFV